MVSTRYKIAILQSHPIQYFAPFFKEITKCLRIDLTVYYCSDFGVKETEDPELGRKIKWDLPLLEGYKYKFLKNYSPTSSILDAPFALINPSIINEILKNRYDAIIIHGWNHITFWFAYISAILNRTPIFTMSETPLNQELLKPRWKILVKRLLFKSLFKWVTVFLAIGTWNKEFYNFYGVSDDRIFFIPYSVDNERFIKSYEEMIKKKNKLKKGLGISQEKVVIMFSGKLIEKKRPLDILMAYEKIKLGNKALIFVGDGCLKETLKSYVKEKGLQNVYFIGFKNQSELSRYYAMADLFVLPSGIGETWGLVVNEAMCFHLPIVASNIVGCVRDLVEHGKNGFIFKAGDVDALSKMLTRLLKDSKLRKKFGKESFGIISKWDYKADIKGILSALDTLPKKG